MNVGIYPRKLLFFTILIALGFFGYKFYSNSLSQVKADKIFASPADNVNMSQNSEDYYLELNLQEDGSVYVGSNKKIQEGINILADKDELRYMILDQPQSYYQNAEIAVILPKKLNRLVEDPEIIAVHGAKPWGAFLSEDGKKIVYRATDVGSSATVTITAGFPKGYFSFPASKAVKYRINSIPAVVWLAGGVVIPPIALLVFIYMFFKSGKTSIKKTVGIVETPPANLPPAIVSVLAKGYVGPHTIIATLVDLAQRGYIDIYNRDDDFVIYKKTTTPQQDAHLRIFERILLEKIFLPTQKRVGSFDVEARIARHLFSRKVAVFYLNVYQEATSLGYFTQVPASLHLKYRLFGIGTFFMGLIGYIAFAIFAPDPKVVLFFWVAAIFLGILIVNLAPKLTVFTQRGMLTQENWLKFKNFLSQGSLYRGGSDLFEIYLPYAIAFEVEAAWAARCAEKSFIKPDWYDYPGRLDGVESFVKSFLPVVDYVGESLNLSSEPLVK